MFMPMYDVCVTQLGSTASVDSSPSDHASRLPHHHQQHQRSCHMSARKGRRHYPPPFMSPSFPPPPGMSFPLPGMSPSFIAPGIPQQLPSHAVT